MVVGRADYFGLAVNRAARFLGAACGGQVLAERALVEEVVQYWHSLVYKWVSCSCFSALSLMRPLYEGCIVCGAHHQLLPLQASQLVIVHEALLFCCDALLVLCSCLIVAKAATLGCSILPVLTLSSHAAFEGRFGQHEHCASD